MPRVETIACDACGYDLTTTSNCVDYRLALLNQPIRSKGGMVTAMAAYPALDHDYYFCDWKCFKQWCAVNVTNEPPPPDAPS